MRTYLGGLILALFVLMQGLAAAHASEHGHDPHEHDGVVCEIALIAEETDILLPPVPELPAPASVAEPVPAMSFHSADTPSPRSRAPPGRAPPLTHS